MKRVRGISAYFVKPKIQRKPKNGIKNIREYKALNMKPPLNGEKLMMLK